MQTTAPIDAIAVLAALADGREVATVYGPDRADTAERLHACLRGIMPTRGDSLRHAYGYGPTSRVRAYVAGREHLRSCYYEYGLTRDLPPLGSDDLPEDPTPETEEHPR